MADITAGGSSLGTGDVEITGTTTVTGTLDASGATEVRLGTTVATELLVGAGSGGDINVGEGLNKLGDVLGADYKNPEFNSLKVTGETTLGATTADSLTIGGTDIGATVATNTGDIATLRTDTDTLRTDVGTLRTDVDNNAANITANTAQIATNTGDIGVLRTDVDTLRLDTNTLRTDVDTLRVDTNTLRTDVNNNTAEIGKIGTVLGADYKNPEFNSLKVAGDTTLDGALTANAGATVTGGLTADAADVIGDATVGGTLYVAGDTTLDGALTANAGATVTGGLTADTADVTGDATVGGNLDVTGDLSAANGTFGTKVEVGMAGNNTVIENGTVTATGLGKFGSLEAGSAEFSGLKVNGATELNGALGVNGNVHATGNISTDGNISAVNGTFTGDVSAKDGTFTGTMTAQDAVINNNLNVGNDATIDGTLSAGAGNVVADSSGLTVGNKVTVGAPGSQTTIENGNITTDGNLGIGGTLDVAGDANFASNATVEKDLTVNGNTDLNGTLDVAGDANFASNATVEKDLTVNGNTDLNGTLDVAGDANFASNATVEKDLTVKGDATVDGMLYAKEGGVFSNNASDFAAGTVTAINGVGMDIYENGTLAAYYGRYGMKVGGLTYDGSSNRLDMGGGTITGLADGGVYRGSSDAVTGNQLWQAYRRMDDLQESINIVGAHAAALSGLAPVPYNPYQPTTLSAAFGTYRDEYAVAVGVYHYVRDNVMFNLGASLCSDGDMMGRAGISFAVGQKDKNKPALAQNMNDVQKQLMEVQYALQELKDENEALKKQLPKQ